MASAYGLSQGILPIKYLGVPLIPHKMKASDFQPLLERIQSKFTSWTTRHLSFAGRLQLLQSVINSIINFWASIFILPSKCLTEIEKLCNAFLWSGTTLSGKKAKISWEAVCTPRSSGGLGLRRLAKWNSVLSLKLIWLLFSSSGSLWVSWVRANLLGSSSLWEISSSQSSGSWLWNKILKLRDLARSFIHCRIGSGSTCSFWKDNWTGFGPLLPLLGPSAPRITGIDLDSSVSQAISHHQWRLSYRSRNPTISFLRNILPSPTILIHPHSEDQYLWLLPGEDITTAATPSRFSAAKTFSALNPAPPEVSWHKTIWFSGRIPKHAFITWLATRDRLATRERLHRFVPSIPTSCLLCQASTESRDHLFFLCSYSHSILSQVLHMIPTHCDILSLLQWLPRSSSNKQLRIIAHLLIQASIYIIWKERNSRLHTSSTRPAIQLVRDIHLLTKSKLLAITRSTSPSTPSLLESWFGLQLHIPPFAFRS